MASTFSFGFSGDDIDEEDAVLNNLSAGDAPAQGQSATADLPRLVQAEKHNMREWVSFIYCLSSTSHVSQNSSFIPLFP